MARIHSVTRTTEHRVVTTPKVLRVRLDLTRCEVFFLRNVLRNIKAIYNPLGYEQHKELLEALDSLDMGEP